jgi:hypothetical protein
LKYDRLRNFCSWFAHQIKGLNGLITTTILLKRNKFVLKNPNDPNIISSTTIDPMGSIVIQFGVKAL